MYVPATAPIGVLAPHPGLLRDTLRSGGVAVQMMTPPELECNRLAASVRIILVDVRGLCLTQIADLLCRLRQAQRWSNATPLVLVPRAAVGIQRLIAAMPDLIAVILTPDDDATIFMWLLAPLDLIRTQLWVNLPKPERESAHPHLTELVAALGHVQSVEQAAEQIALSPNAAYHALSDYLCIPSEIPIRRSILRWRALLSLQLCGADAEAAVLKMRRAVPDGWARTLAPQVIGAELQSVTCDGQRVQLHCHVPGETHRVLVLKARSPRPTTTSVDISQFPAWARMIDWIDMVDADVCAIGLVGGMMIEIPSREWRVEWVGKQK